MKSRQVKHLPKLKPTGVSGLWEARWPDGVIVVISARDESRGGWRADPDPFYEIDPNWLSEDNPTKPYAPYIPIPDAECSTRRELVQILTEWRRREMSAAAEADAELGISPEPKLRAWAPNARVVAGWWDLEWEDGVGVEIHREGGKWWASVPYWRESGAEYEPLELIPEVEPMTRRELIAVLCEWRRRDLAARAARDTSG